MPVEVALAVLAAALLHASWHALVQSSGDQVVALAGMSLVSGSVALAILPWVKIPTSAVLAVMAASVLLHGAYKVVLARLYKTAQLSIAYPMARGLTPVMATALGALLLAQWPTGQAALGVALVSGGICALVLKAGKFVVRPAAMLAALLVGITVAAYSTVDAYGIAMYGEWLGFTAWLIATDSLVFIGYAVMTRGRTAWLSWRADWARTVISGLLGTGSFCVFMWALARAPVGPVTALRETSILFTALIGIFFLRERLTPLRALAAGIVMAGAATIALS
jgi:drug/metabolite transporter (DMT)-like permease